MHDRIVIIWICSVVRPLGPSRLTTSSPFISIHRQNIPIRPTECFFRILFYFTTSSHLALGLPGGPCRVLFRALPRIVYGLWFLRDACPANWRNLPLFTMFKILFSPNGIINVALWLYHRLLASLDICLLNMKMCFPSLLLLFFFRF